MDEKTKENWGTVDQIREALRARLTPNAGGSIALTARAWAVQGTAPLDSAC